MTEEEFKKVMTKTIIFIVIALIILIVIGIFVFNKSGKSLSIFADQKEVDNYKKKVEEVNSSVVIEEENLENIEDVSNEGENVSNEETPENNQIEGEGEIQAEIPSEEIVQ